jgi:WD40 repeat protein
MPRSYSLRTLAVAGVLMVASSPDSQADEPDAAEVRVVAFSGDGKLLAVGSGIPETPGAVTLWDVATRKVLWNHQETKGVPAVAFAPDGQTLAIGTYDHCARILNVADGKEKRALGHPREVRAVAFSPDGKRLGTACWDGVIRIWDLLEGTEKVTCQPNKDRLFSLEFSPDGKRLLAASGDEGARLWDAETGKEIRSWSANRSYVRCARFTSDGRWALVGAWDGTVRLWRVDTGTLRAQFGSMGGVEGIAFSPQARTMAIVDTLDKVIHLYDFTLEEPTVQEQERIRSLLVKLDDDSYAVREGAGKELLRIGFLAEQELRKAMVESASVEVRIRARRLRQELLSQSRMVLRGHTDEVTSVAFAPDGMLLASSSKDGTVRLWDCSTGKEVARLQGGDKRDPP